MSMEQDRNTRINRTTTEQQSPVNNQNVTTKEQMNKNCISNRTPTEEYKMAGAQVTLLPRYTTQ
jgi:hypothetical protein